MHEHTLSSWHRAIIGFYYTLVWDTFENLFVPIKVEADRRYRQFKTATYYEKCFEGECCNFSLVYILPRLKFPITGQQYQHNQLIFFFFL